MSKNISQIPFTELWERVRKLARVGDNTEEKIRGIIQDVYIREIPSKFDWNFLIANSALQTVNQYNTGTVTINTDDTAAIFSSDASVTAAMVGRKIKFDSNDAIYDIIVQNNSTSLTINPSFQGASNISTGGYKIFQPNYPLAGDFDRFPKNGGIYKWTGGKKEVLEEESIQENLLFSDPTPAIPQKVRLVGMDTAGNQLVSFRPPPKDARNYGYEYLKALKPLTETTAGTISSIASSATAVVGNTNTRFLEAMTDGTYWFRVDALGTSQDSSWYPILAIQHNSSLTLGVAFANTAITSSANYTIARAPEMPVRLHAAILYGALHYLTADQNDENSLLWRNQYAQVLSDAKRIYVSRVYSQEVTGVFEEYRYRR